ncbi:MAG TPA: F0F1 ATP synthase subunit epsilon [Bacteroidota bacterium]|nr:F0F1 ATP synthase subunit epsilon [Bacteroidota bacterium]
MYERTFALRIVAPRGVVFEGEAASVSAPGTLGSFQVLFNHAPLLSSLEIGPLKVKDPAGADTHYATGGGFLEVNRNRVVVLVESAELPEEIDVARARAARARAEERLKSHDPLFDIRRAELALARALNRLSLAGRSQA